MKKKLLSIALLTSGVFVQATPAPVFAGLAQQFGFKSTPEVVVPVAKTWKESAKGLATTAGSWLQLAGEKTRVTPATKYVVGKAMEYPKSSIATATVAAGLVAYKYGLYGKTANGVKSLANRAKGLFSRSTPVEQEQPVVVNPVVNEQDTRAAAIIAQMNPTTTPVIEQQPITRTVEVAPVVDTLGQEIATLKSILAQRGSVYPCGKYNMNASDLKNQFSRAAFKAVLTDAGFSATLS